jgi:hypothetical protein
MLKKAIKSHILKHFGRLQRSYENASPTDCGGVKGLTLPDSVILQGRPTIDIPEMVLAGGIPARVIKTAEQITSADAKGLRR